MNSPTPIDELPSFIEENYNVAQPVHSPWLKYMIVGGIVIIAIAISALMVVKSQRKIITIKPKQNEN